MRHIEWDDADFTGDDNVDRQHHHVVDWWIDHVTVEDRMLAEHLRTLPGAGSAAG